MKFKYRRFDLFPPSDFFGKFILKPIITIKISRAGMVVKYAALIDSGADFCIFDAGIGEYLELDVRSGIEVGFGGIQNAPVAKAYLHQVNLEIGGVQFKTDIGFSYDISDRGYGIFGQKGFFNKFIVKFDLEKEEIEIKKRI
ncbi:hypothetical protein HYW41_04735 [Candidatus Daviesbacteria bacterium]|nr:hypothetical protein [Candidatus Daviesbacteria bacterium]